MRKFILKLNDSYVKTFLLTKLFSQFVVFIITIILVLELTGFINAVVSAQSISDEMRWSIYKTTASYLLLIFLFGSRFLLLFSKRKLFFWISQIIWLTTYIALLLHTHSTEFGGCTKNMFPMFGEILSYIFVIYLLASPLQQAGILGASFFRIYEEK